MTSKLKIWALGAVMLLPACDSILNPDPQQSLGNEQVFTTATGAEAALVGVYDDLQLNMDENIIQVDLAGEYADHTGSFPDWQEIDNYSMDAANAEARDKWINLYDIINGANLVIANVPAIEDVNLSDARKAELLGEARVLRAYSYLQLVSSYGGVPLVTIPTTSVGDEVFVSRATEAEIWAQIDTDLATAIGELASNVAPGLVDVQVAQALRARAALQSGNHAVAMTAAEAVINSGEFALATPTAIYQDLNSSESIWELQFDSQDPNSMAFWAFTSAAGGRREYAPNAAFKALFANGLDTLDMRYEFLIADQNGVDIANKYFRVAQGDDNYFLARYAEVLLIWAEAATQVDFAGNKAVALDYVNQIRTRSGLAVLDGATIADQASMLDTILAERAIELAFEGHRWFDLKRLDKTEEMLGITNPNVLLWPIPERDTDTNPNLEQNPGY